jgi:hypothetical protein
MVKKENAPMERLGRPQNTEESHLGRVSKRKKSRSGERL